mmetsp:Transcript_46883/g.111609  ORF Transcript_46883/g.111609 Transcript_46883/m.111609 type:complete len:221 (+) Transcript_46883:205-867(+)
MRFLPYCEVIRPRSVDTLRRRPCPAFPNLRLLRIYSLWSIHRALPLLLGLLKCTKSFLPWRPPMCLTLHLLRWCTRFFLSSRTSGPPMCLNFLFFLYYRPQLSHLLGLLGKEQATLLQLATKGLTSKRNLSGSVALIRPHRSKMLLRHEVLAHDVDLSLRHERPHPSHICTGSDIIHGAGVDSTSQGKLTGAAVAQERGIHWRWQSPESWANRCGFPATN